MRSTRGATVALLLAGVLALQALPASSAVDTANDPNDTKGKLDLAVLHFEKDSGKAPLHVVVKTYEKWGKSVLRDDVNRLIVRLDVDRDGMPDYRARIRESGGDLYVKISGSGSSFEPIAAHKPNPRTVRFTIPGDSPPNPKGKPPQMRAYSRFVESLPCDTASGHGPCVDRAPDSGWL